MDISEEEIEQRMATRPDLVERVGNGDAQAIVELIEVCTGARGQLAPSGIAELEARVNDRWGDQQTNWTIGKCPEGWFYYCGTRMDPDDRPQFAHKGYAPTLTAVLQAMLDFEEP